MLKSFISTASLLITLVVTSFTQIAAAGDLPDFTVLAEKHGAEVVNISVTQVVQAGGFPIAGMPDDPELQEFLKRFPQYATSR